jgi:hypothetical protein
VLLLLVTFALALGVLVGVAMLDAKGTCEDTAVAEKAGAWVEAVALGSRAVEAGLRTLSGKEAISGALDCFGEWRWCYWWEGWRARGERSGEGA